MRSSSGLLLAAFAIALGLALAIGFGEAKPGFLPEQENTKKEVNSPKGAKPLVKLARICAGETEGLEITSIEALEALKDDILEAKDKCNDVYVAALNQLAATVTDGPNVCSQNKATKIAEFYKYWIAFDYAPPKDGYEKPELPLPFRDFFLAYGLKMSALCEETMMKRFTLGPKPSKDDFDDIQPLYEPGSPIDSLLTPLIKSDAIARPSLISTVLALLGDGGMLVQSDHGDISQLEDAQKVCRLRFRPIYKQFLEPIVVLAQSGLAHRSEYFEQIKSQRSSELDSWMKAIFTCELLDSLQFDTRGASKGSDDGEQPDSEQEVEFVSDMKWGIVLDETFLRHEDDSLKNAVKEFAATKCDSDRLWLIWKIWTNAIERYFAVDRLGALVELIGEMKRNEDNERLSLVEKVLKRLSYLEASERAARNWGIASDLYHARALGSWFIKAAIAGLLLPPEAALHPAGNKLELDKI
jgi:hypothetical protein